MQSSSRISAVCALLAATLLLPAAALAQSPATPAKPVSRSEVHRPSAKVAPDRVEARITDLHARLHITSEQKVQWDQFAQVMRDNAQHMRQRAEDRAIKIKSMNAGENMLSFSQIAMQHAQDLETLAAAFQPLYTSLSQEQQRTADAMFRDVGMRHGPSSPQRKHS